MKQIRCLGIAHSVTHILAEDFDADGKVEVAVGTEYYGCDLVNHDGTMRWVYRLGTSEFTAVSAADVNGDGLKEVLMGTMAGTLHAISPKVVGEHETSTPPYKIGYTEAVWIANLGDEVTAILPADVNGDGTLEIVATSMEGNLYVLNLSG